MRLGICRLNFSEHPSEGTPRCGGYLITNLTKSFGPDNVTDIDLKRHKG